MTLVQINEMFSHKFNNTNESGQFKTFLLKEKYVCCFWRFFFHGENVKKI